MPTNMLAGIAQILDSLDDIGLVLGTSSVTPPCYLAIANSLPIIVRLLPGPGGKVQIASDRFSTHLLENLLDQTGRAIRHIESM